MELNASSLSVLAGVDAANAPQHSARDRAAIPINGKELPMNNDFDPSTAREFDPATGRFVDDSSSSPRLSLPHVDDVLALVMRAAGVSAGTEG